jgi:hypothetical protein
MVYDGMACATDLIRVQRSAHDKHLLLHPLSLASSCSSKKWKSFVLDFVKNIGAPRYFVSRLRLFICSNCLTACMAGFEEAFKNANPDFALLICCSNQVQYFSRQLLSDEAFLLSALEKERCHQHT